MIQLGACAFDPTTQVLRAPDGKRVALRAQSLKVLECLIAANGAVMTKEQLVKTVWATVAVTDDSLVQCIGEIRIAIGDAKHEVLQTELRRGYRLAITAGERAAYAGFRRSANATEFPVNTSQTQAAPAAIQAAAQGSKDKQLAPPIAVMPFASQDGGERSDRSTTSFAGSLISELAHLKDLRIIDRQSAFALKGHGLSSAEICEKLKARFLVTGQVRRLDAAIQWSIELIDGHSEEIVWYDHGQLPVSTQQMEMGALMSRLAGAINIHFTTYLTQQSMHKAPEEPSAYELGLRVYSIWMPQTIESMRQAQLLGAKAVTLHPWYAPAWSMLALTHMMDILQCQTGAWKEARTGEALHEIRTAIALDPQSATSFGILSWLLMIDGQFQEAHLASRRSMELGPAHPLVLTLRANVLSYSGQYEEAKAAIESAMATAPGGNQSAVLGRICLALGDADRCIDLELQALNVMPGNSSARMTLIAALEEEGEHARAAEHFKILLATTIGFNEGHFGKRWQPTPELRERFINALRAHGMKPASN